MKISFTGMTIDSRSLKGQFFSGWRYPVDWERIVISGTNFIDEAKLSAFARENMIGKYTFFSSYDVDGPYVVMLFEQVNDAIIFKMLDGGKQCGLDY